MKKTKKDRNYNISNVMPKLPDGLDDDSNCDHNFKLGWIACWKKLQEMIGNDKYTYTNISKMQ